jgi:hypothetical protein
VGCERVLHLGEDLLDGVELLALAGQRGRVAELAVDAVPVAGLERDRVDAQRTAEAARGNGPEDVLGANGVAPSARVAPMAPV